MTDTDARVAAELRELAPTWERAVWLRAKDTSLGGFRRVRFVHLLAAGQAPVDRICTSCHYRVRVEARTGFNRVPQVCPLCRGAFVWDIRPREKEPEIEVAVEPGGNIPASEFVHWGVSFDAWASLRATVAMPEPVWLITAWALEHQEGKPPRWTYLAEAAEQHLGLGHRPHTMALARLWERMRREYEGDERPWRTL